MHNNMLVLCWFIMVIDNWLLEFLLFGYYVYVCGEWVDIGVF